MAFTHKPDYSSPERISFKREESGFLAIVFAIGGIVIVGLGVINLPVFQAYLVIVFGLAFAGAAFYLPEILSDHSPNWIELVQHGSFVHIGVKGGNSVFLSFKEVVGFEILEEKRSPSAANSKGINFIHYHIVLKRINGGYLELTSTTNKGEAEKILRIINERISLATVKSLSFQEMDQPKTLLVKKEDSMEITFPYGDLLSIDENALVYTDKAESDKPRKFLARQFKGAVYSYTNTLKSKTRNLSLLFGEESDTQTEIKVFLKGLNPVECLQVELWLNQIIHKLQADLTK